MCIRDRYLAITKVTDNTFTVNVGTSPIVNYNVSAATYDPTSGDLQMTIGSHSFDIGDSIKLKDNSLTFTCDFNNDGNTTNKTYPRSTGASTTGNNGADYAYNTALPITAKTATQITVNVNGGQGAITDTTAHNFVSATAGAVITGGDYVHTFVQASTDGITRAGDSIRLSKESLTFTCDYNGDGNATNKFYPRSSGSNYPGGADPTYNTSTPIQSVGSTNHTVTAATYAPTTGVMTLTVNGHNFNSSTNLSLIHI